VLIVIFGLLFLILLLILLYILFRRPICPHCRRRHAPVTLPDQCPYLPRRKTGDPITLQQN
jgi:hypothetical protein